MDYIPVSKVLNHSQIIFISGPAAVLWLMYRAPLLTKTNLCLGAMPKSQSMG